MREPWQVVVVRVWRLDHRHIIRMTMSTDGDSLPRTAYATSSRSAADLLARWLEEGETSLEGPDPDAPVEAAHDEG